MQNIASVASPPTMRGLPDLVARHARLSPMRPAVTDAIAALSYADLAREVEILARLLASHDLRPGDRAAIVCENTAGALVAMLATQKLEAWPAMINARLPRREIDAMTGLVSARLVIYCVAGSSAASALAEAANAIATETLACGSFAIADGDASALPEPVETDPSRQCALLILTSGTTGFPKAVMLSHAALVDMAESLAGARKTTAGDRVSGASPLSHIMGISVACSTLWAGACLEMGARLDLAEMVARLRDGRMTQISVVPTLYARLVEYIAANRIDLNGHRLAYASCGGAPLDPTLKNKVEALFGIPLVNGYGMTECAPLSRSRQRWGNHPESVGPPERGVTVRVVSPDGADLPDGEVGELWARSPSGMMGYYRNPAATRQALRDGGWIATGDLARILPDGDIAIVGRVKEMIIRSGFNVYPAEVEAEINSHPQVLQSAVAGIEAGDGNEEVVAFIQPRTGCDLTPSEIERHLRDRLAPYKVPGRILIRETLPLGSTGKLLKRQLISELKPAER